MKRLTLPNSEELHARKASFRASILIVCSSILYGFLGYFGTSILRENFSITAMLFWCFFIAGTYMGLFVISNPFKDQVKTTVNRRVLLYLFLLGVISYGGSSVLYFMASQYIGTGLSMVIFFSYPVIIAFVSWLLYRQRLRIGTILALFCMLAGLFLLQSALPHSFKIMGFLYGILSAIFYALYILLNKRFCSTAIDPATLTTVICFSCAAIFITFSLITHNFMLPHSVKTWIYFLILGIFVTALPMQLVLKGLQHISPLRASVISVLEPIISLIMGMLLLGESIVPVQILGSLILISSVVFVQIQKEL